MTLRSILVHGLVSCATVPALLAAAPDVVVTNARSFGGGFHPYDLPGL
jgi:hypothetical protein